MLCYLNSETADPGRRSASAFARYPRVAVPTVFRPNKSIRSTDLVLPYKIPAFPRGTSIILTRGSMASTIITGS
jgi:hypothetical protein